MYASIFAVLLIPQPGLAKGGDELYIGCDVCKQAMGVVYGLTEKDREAAPYKKLGEDKIEALVNNICKPESEDGKWIKMQDIVESKVEGVKYLGLQGYEGQQKCKDECMSIAKSCSMLMEDEMDVDKLVSYLYKKKGDAKTLIDLACNTWTKRCKKQVPVPDSYTRTDSPFEEMSKKDIEMEGIMAKLKESGMGAQMFDSDSLQKKIQAGENPFPDDDEDSDLEDVGGMEDGDPYAGDFLDNDYEL